MAEYQAGPSLSVGQPRPVKFALLAALSSEIQPLLRHLAARRRQDLDFPVWELQAGDNPGIAAVTGMGAASAQRTFFQVLTCYRPETILSAGFGGALTPDLPRGALVLGASVWQYDANGRELHPGAAPGSPGMLREFQRRLEAAGLPVFLGNVITTSRIISKRQHGGLWRHLPYALVDLETAALAEAAAQRQLPFLGLRAVTDEAEEEIPDFICQAVESGSTFGPFTVLRWLATRPTAIVQLALLWQRSRTAARQLSRTLKVLLAWL
jgi:adenosylhomocysteine nucleosidase